MPNTYYVIHSEAMIKLSRSIHEALDYLDWKTNNFRNDECSSKIEHLKDCWPPKGEEKCMLQIVVLVKCKVDSSMKRYKARHVAKGFIQNYALDY